MRASPPLVMPTFAISCTAARAHARLASLPAGLCVPRHCCCRSSPARMLIPSRCMLGVLNTRLLCPPLRRRRRLRRPVLRPRLLRHPLDAAHGLCQQLRRWPLPLVLRLPPAVSSGPCVGRLAAKSSGHDSVVVRLHDHFSIGHARASIPGLALPSSKLPACVPRHSWTALPCVI